MTPATAADLLIPTSLRGVSARSSSERSGEVSERLSAAQIEALASDASSLNSARVLARPGSWQSTGAGGEPAGVWGLCRGSGAKPYQTAIDVTEPAYSCSCPSRKFPCKHALALLLLWSAGEVPDGEAPDWVLQWHQGRAERAAKAAARAAKVPSPRDASEKGASEEDASQRATSQRGASQRAEQRADRVAGGLAELDQWLTDQIRGGLAGLEQAGYRHFDQIAARLVDAQAPGVASDLRRLAGLVGQAGNAGPESWPERLLAELSLLRLLTNGHRRLGQLPEPLAQTIRSRIGFPVATDVVLAGPRHRDDWQVIGIRDEVGEQLTTRRAWLVGATTGTAALVLSFAAMGQTLSTDLIVGTRLDADLCFYPGAPLRALFAQRHDAPRPLTEPTPAGGVQHALAGYAGGLAANPWLTAWPVIVRGTLLPGRPWRLVDAAGDALPLWPGSQPWPLLAAGGGEPVILAAEYGPVGLRPLAGYHDGEVVLP